ncbi:expressed unknown protein [Seminavis robusta]|uniref:Uncharacterized protein n=1 Tax=Seminavis robusta TaxID=568900 RepID=A0A9N8H4A0_9STRA|nr:expressed unknown protein [Seminavis robusta]|eukprot:Sro6_g004840.1 n/a (175) ;mRNA; r:28879-29403
MTGGFISKARKRISWSKKYDRIVEESTDSFNSSAHKKLQVDQIVSMTELTNYSDNSCWDELKIAECQSCSSRLMIRNNARKKKVKKKGGPLRERNRPFLPPKRPSSSFSTKSASNASASASSRNSRNSNYYYMEMDDHENQDDDEPLLHWAQLPFANASQEQREFLPVTLGVEI